jgi:predicted RNA-binding Zn ribbon-like protein
MIESLGSSVIELLNSGELLEDDEWLADALDRWDLAPNRPIRPGDRDALRELRALLQRLAIAVSKHETLPPAELAAFNEVIGATPVRAQLELAPGGGYILDLHPLAADWFGYVVRELAGEFGSMLRLAFPPRIKLCEECGSVFWDGTRSRTRRWCDSRTCGNRVRVRRHRARQ